LGDDINIRIVSTGGTLDITAHQSLGPDQIVEIHRVSGDNLGGRQVNQKFEEIMFDLYNKQIIETVMWQHPRDWMNIMDYFEESKKKIRRRVVDGKAVITGAAMEKVKLSKECLQKLKYFNKKSEYAKDGVKIKGEYLVIPTLFIIKVIESVTTKITQHVGDLIRDVKQKHHLDAILLVGGFAKSPILIRGIEKCVGASIPVFRPHDSELCVVKGAVMFGWKRDIIRSRKSRFTYGIRTSEALSKDQVVGFYSLVTVDEDVEIDKCIQAQFFHPLKDTSTHIKLYSTTEKNPTSFREEKMKLVGDITLPNGKEKYNKPIIIKLYFGETDIRLNVYDEHTNETYCGRFDTESHFHAAVKFAS